MLPPRSFDSYLAVALTARGARCDVALCDAALPACLAADYTWYPNLEQFAAHGSRDDLCTACLAPAEKLFGAAGLGLDVHRYGDLLTEADRTRALTVCRVHAASPKSATSCSTASNVGEAALSGALRFFARGEMDGAARRRSAILRRYLEAACLAQFAMRRLIARERYDVVIGHHGIYVPQALVAEAARRPACDSWHGIPHIAPAASSSIMARPITAACCASRPRRGRIWPRRGRSAQLVRYLADREKGAQDWIAFHPDDARARGNIAETIGLDPAQADQSRCSPRWYGTPSCITGKGRSRTKSSGCSRQLRILQAATMCSSRSASIRPR